MGATKGTVDKVKFGNELKEVIKSITQLQPDVLITNNGAGNATIFLLLLCAHIYATVFMQLRYHGGTFDN